ncbi:hypothetical protein ABZX65_26535 [Streptomyces sp. NPDC003300]|uniref:hypothetical protein n=1 Tax=unclassified Streptomyces TaxID=2593676 RepID=UPI0033BF0E58
MADQPQQASHFWFMNVVGRNPLGLRQEDHAGHIDLPDGATRWDMYRHIRDMVADLSGLKELTVIAFDIQPNKL